IALLPPVAACQRRPPDVILVLVDTLRADHLSAYRYPRQVSPRIDEFARAATLFESAMAQAPHTIPSVLQIMTSRYVHGSDIDPRVATLAETLHAHGYQTAAVVENANFEAIRDAHGLVRGFDRFYRNGPLHTDNVEQQHWKTKTRPTASPPRRCAGFGPALRIARSFSGCTTSTPMTPTCRRSRTTWRRSPGRVRVSSRVTSAGRSSTGATLGSGRRSSRQRTASI